MPASASEATRQSNAQPPGVDTASADAPPALSAEERQPRRPANDRYPQLPGSRGFKPKFVVPDISAATRRTQYPPSAAPIVSPLGNVTQQMLDLLQSQPHPMAPFYAPTSAAGGVYTPGYSVVSPSANFSSGVPPAPLNPQQPLQWVQFGVPDSPRRTNRPQMPQTPTAEPVPQPGEINTPRSYLPSLQHQSIVDSAAARSQLENTRHPQAAMLDLAQRQMQGPPLNSGREPQGQSRPPKAAYGEDALQGQRSLGGSSFSAGQLPGQPPQPTNQDQLHAHRQSHPYKAAVNDPVAPSRTPAQYYAPTVAHQAWPLTAGVGVAGSEAVNVQPSMLPPHLSWQGPAGQTGYLMYPGMAWPAVSTTNTPLPRATGQTGRPSADVAPAYAVYSYPPPPPSAQPYPRSALPIQVDPSQADAHMQNFRMQNALQAHYVPAYNPYAVPRATTAQDVPQPTPVGLKPMHRRYMGMPAATASPAVAAAPEKSTSNRDSNDSSTSASHRSSANPADTSADVTLMPKLQEDSSTNAQAPESDLQESIESGVDFMDILPDTLFSSVPSSPTMASINLDLLNTEAMAHKEPKAFASCGPKLSQGLRPVKRDYPASIQMLNTVEKKRIMFEKHRLLLQRRKRTKGFKEANKNSNFYKMVGPLVDASYIGKFMCPFTECFESVVGMEDLGVYIDHILKKHLMVGLYVCEYCCTVVSRKDALLRHMQRYHEGRKGHNMFDNLERYKLLMDILIDGGRQVCGMTGDFEPLASAAKLYSQNSIKNFLPAVPPLQTAEEKSVQRRLAGPPVDDATA